MSLSPDFHILPPDASRRMTGHDRRPSFRVPAGIRPECAQNAVADSARRRPHRRPSPRRPSPGSRGTIT